MNQIEGISVETLMLAKKYTDEHGSGGGAVKSVNGKTGDVVLTASDVDAKPASYEAPVSSVAGKTGAVTLDAGDASFDDSVTYQSGTVGAELSEQKNAISQLQPTATASDVGKALVVKTVDAQTGKPTEYEYGSAGGVDLGITGATTGQIIQIESVDGNGRPTSWKAVDESLALRTAQDIKRALNNGRDLTNYLGAQISCKRGTVARFYVKKYDGTWPDVNTPITLNVLIIN